MDTRIEILWCNYNRPNSGQLFLTEHHHSCYQMYYILSGRMDFSVFGESFPASEGSYLVIPAAAPHATHYCAPDTACYEMKFLIKDSFLASHFEQMSAPVYDTGAIRNLLKYVVKNWNSPDEQNVLDINYIVSTVLMSFFVDKLVYKDRKSRYITTASYTPLIKNSILYIERHYPYPFSLDAMAKSMSYNPNYLSGLFKKSTGYSIIDYLNLLRIKNAIIYFFYYNQDVSSTCECVGFNDISYFSRTFKDFTGVSPRDFKRALSHGSSQRESLSAHLESSVMFRVCPIDDAFQALHSIVNYC